MKLKQKVKCFFGNHDWSLLRGTDKKLRLVCRECNKTITNITNPTRRRKANDKIH